MKKFAIFTLLAIQLIAPNMTFAQINKDYSGTYLCITDASGGIFYDDASKQWKGTRFTTGDRYILTAKANGLVNDPIWDTLKMTYIVTWKPLGSNWDDFLSGCTTQSDYLRTINSDLSFEVYDTLKCNSLSNEVRVNFRELRFMQSYLLGFVDGADNNENTPSIEVGTCTKIE